MGEQHAQEGAGRTGQAGHTATTFGPGLAVSDGCLLDAAGLTRADPEHVASGELLRRRGKGELLRNVQVGVLLPEQVRESRRTEGRYQAGQSLL